MECPSCDCLMEGGICEQCGYQEYQVNVGKGLIDKGSVSVPECDRMYCIEKMEDDTFFCPHLEKMAHAKEYHTITIFCNPIPKEEMWQ